MVLIGPHDDGGWSQAHLRRPRVYSRECRRYVHTPISKTCLKAPTRSRCSAALARKGFDLIFGTSFGFGDPMEAVAGEFPDTMFIHLTGIKSNETNFGNLMGAMENMKYLAGMLAGARAKTGWQPETWLYGHLPDPRRNPSGQRHCVGYEEDLPRMYHGCALDQHLARSRDREGSCGFVVRCRCPGGVHRCGYACRR